MKHAQVDVLVIGIGGYGENYIRQLRSTPEAHIAGVIDPFAQTQSDWLALKSAGVNRYESIEDFTGRGGHADLAVISSPIAYHADQSIAALQAGMNVLCEKPLCATIDDAERILKVCRDSDRFMEIGYQWSFSLAIQALKADILNGLFGAPRRLQTMVCWPRSRRYYERNSWAGTIRDPNGNLVYDSPANNAAAHFLHNMLFLTGPSIGLAAQPIRLSAECYRANPIENFDTVCCRIWTDDNVEVLFYASHAVDQEVGPSFRFEFEKCTVEYQVGGNIVANFSGGVQRNYGNPDADSLRKLSYCLERCLYPEEASTTICGPDAAISHTRCIEGIQRIPIVSFPNDLLRQKDIGNGENVTYLPGMVDNSCAAFRRGLLFSEMDLCWSVPIVEVTLMPKHEILLSNKR